MDELLLAVESSDALVARLMAFCDQSTSVYELMCVSRERADVAERNLPVCASR